MVGCVVSRTTVQRRYRLQCLILAGLVACTAVLGIAQSNSSQATAVPGKLDDGTVLLPNGWHVAPAGRHLAVGTLPLNVVVAPDGRYAIVMTNGLQKPALTIVDLTSWTIKSTVAL